jgi:hypothetical protein
MGAIAEELPGKCLTYSLVCSVRHDAQKNRRELPAALRDYQSH